MKSCVWREKRMPYSHSAEDKLWSWLTIKHRYFWAGQCNGEIFQKRYHQCSVGTKHQDSLRLRMQNILHIRPALLFNLEANFWFTIKRYSYAKVICFSPSGYASGHLFERKNFWKKVQCQPHVSCKRHKMSAEPPWDASVLTWAHEEATLRACDERVAWFPSAREHATSV